MDELAGPLLVQFRTALSPFLLLTSCATLVWSLQGRYSRVVQRIRSLSAESPEHRSSPAEQIEHIGLLKSLRERAWMLRNSVAGHYLAMMCFLLSVVLLSVTTLTPWAFPGWSVGFFIAGLILICLALLNTTLEIVRSYHAIEEEFEKRANR